MSSDLMAMIILSYQLTVDSKYNVLDMVAQLTYVLGVASVM